MIDLMLNGELAVVQAQLPECLLLDPFALFDDGAAPAKTGIDGCHVAGGAKPFGDRV